MMDKYDPMNMYKSAPRGRGKVVTEQELAEQKARKESSHQLEFCKWIKHTYPEIRFRSDMQAGQKRSGYMQNLVDILDPFSGWPDVSIWIGRGNYCGLMIEMKRENSGAILKDGSLSQSKHVQNQHQVHEFLRGLGWKVEIAEGCDEAKKVLEEYLNPPVKKKSRCCGRCDGVSDICVADMVCEEHKEMGCEICYGER